MSLFNSAPGSQNPFFKMADTLSPEAVQQMQLGDWVNLLATMKLNATHKSEALGAINTKFQHIKKENDA
jgi:hypothetical protein